MGGIYILLLLMIPLGFVPFFVVLYKRNRVKKILQTGNMAKARIYKIHTSPKFGDTVLYTFYNDLRQQYFGSLHSKRDAYRVNDIIVIYYLPQNPKRNTLQGAWASPIFLIFTLAIALFVLFAVYKLHEMVQTGAL